MKIKRMFLCFDEISCSGYLDLEKEPRVRFRRRGTKIDWSEGIMQLSSDQLETVEKMIHDFNPINEGVK